MSQFPTDPTNVAAMIAGLARRLAALEARTPSATSYLDAAGVVRCRVGQHSDGKFGMRVFAADGVTVLVDQTA